MKTDGRVLTPSFHIPLCLTKYMTPPLLQGLFISEPTPRLPPLQVDYQIISVLTPHTH